MQTNNGIEESGTETMAAEMVFESFFDDDSKVWSLRRVSAAPRGSRKSDES
ncbi:MAG: hypothetical protein U0270_13240 [Labilithrix sp.]